MPSSFFSSFHSDLFSSSLPSNSWRIFRNFLRHDLYRGRSVVVLVLVVVVVAVARDIDFPPVGGCSGGGGALSVSDILTD